MKPEKNNRQSPNFSNLSGVETTRKETVDNKNLGELYNRYNILLLTYLGPTPITESCFPSVHSVTFGTLEVLLVQSCERWSR